MYFHETDMGNRFFNDQLPKLLDILDKMISDALCKEPAHNIADVGLPENYLEDLFYGNLEIGAFSREGYDNTTNRKIIEAQDQLKAQLTAEQWEMLTDYSVLLNARESEECFRMFQHGYRTAMRLILAGIQPISEEPKEK